MVDKKSDEKQAEELKKIRNHYLDKKKRNHENTSFKIEDVFGDVITKDNCSEGQITKPNNLLAKIM